MIGNPFYEIAGLLVLAAVLGAAANRLRQPLVIVYIVVGIVSGPTVLGWTSARDEIGLLAELGITILLFLVGMKLDVGLVRDLGFIIVVTAGAQLALTLGIAYGLSVALGLSSIAALYVAVALGFSSTIIVVKLLSDKRELDSLHGRVAVGVLIVQDVGAVVAIAVAGAFEEPALSGTLRTPVALAAGLAFAAVVLFLLARYVFPPLLHRLARSQELLLVVAVAWGILLAAAADAAGVSKEIGAFVAGFSLASTGYREVIGAKLTSLRDFLLFFFFIDLGSRMEFEDVGQTLVQAAVLALFVLIGKTVIITGAMGLLGYRKRTGFLAGVTLSQISEFSLIFIGVGMATGHLADEVMGLVTMVAVITITISAYVISYAHRLYARIDGWLSVFERPDPFRERRYEEELGKEAEADILVFGLGRFGRPLVRHLREGGCRVVGIDFDPEALRRCGSEQLPVVFGDAGDPDFLVQLGPKDARWVVSTIRDLDVNVVLVQTLRREGFSGSVAVSAHSEEDADALRSVGATEVWIPYLDAAALAASRLGAGSEQGAEA